ncbi:MAG TPA: glycogen synthase [Flavobacteriales bacterium]|nr:glycogen synthase [Flavobacteriales bacterium]|tara:strand:+ start:21977 stop:22807 length:831 start_codon:yes stop_codon:yes gene_type:complete
MSKKRVLIISQEITPYTEENEISKISRYLPQGIQEKGKEIRMFMPRYGVVNERRHQLHEVIRLSGMNLIINDEDHPLIIKVASIPQARMQVYFIDNEDYFKRKAVHHDKETGEFFADNDERAIFFGKGVIETVKKLGWAPDIIHCHGWMTAMVPMYIRTAYKNEPIFANSKIVFSLYNNPFDGTLNNEMAKKAIMDGVSGKDVENLAQPTFENLNKAAMTWSDAVIKGSEKLPEGLEKAFNDSDKMKLGYHNEDSYIDAYSDFYDEILETNEVMAD